MTDAPALLERRFQLAETQRNVWFATVEERVKPEDVLQPGFWAHVASKMRPYDEIVVAIDSCAWRMELLVADAWHSGLRVVELNRVDMTAAEGESSNDIADDLRVRWGGPVNRWTVIRKSDGVTLKAGLPDKNAALENLAAIASERAAIGN